MRRPKTPGPIGKVSGELAPPGALRPLPFHPYGPREGLGHPAHLALCLISLHLLGGMFWGPLPSPPTSQQESRGGCFLGLPFQGTTEWVARNHSNLVSQFGVQSQGRGRAMLPRREGSFSTPSGFWRPQMLLDWWQCHPSLHRAFFPFLHVTFPLYLCPTPPFYEVVVV